MNYTILEQRTTDGEMQFLICHQNNEREWVGRVVKKDDKWEGWFLQAGLMGRGWCKERDKFYPTEDDAIIAVRKRVQDECWTPV